MKTRRVKIGIKSVEEVLDSFAKTGEAIERGEKVKKQRGVYFTNIEGFRKALTPKRLELLRLIKKKRPKSLQGLARLAGRDMRAVVTDVEILKNLDLIEIKSKKTGRKESMPEVNYDKIELEIVV